MCVNYIPVTRQGLDFFNTVAPADAEWPAETWQDYPAPIIRRHADGGRETLVGTYDMVPQKDIPAHIKKYSTMNARSEDIGSKRSYSKAWREGQLCLVPMVRFFEPNWETGVHVRWAIGMRDQAPFAVAGLWRAKEDKNSGTLTHSFTQLTINADGHRVMDHFHRPNQKKRSLVIVPEADYDDWLDCRDPELARAYLNLYPFELVAAEPAPKLMKA
ncbi:SOS response-associated peptidase family protein [Janthinobacterium sp. NKUCC06_STL]|uniref:SOS response-associated peptidase family protein n=1 Tax=Janthinobacterium sp. NKUCC06_STL TaxID=2842127 RepID=UPI001C5BA6BF|nr:SOS response-associated peptidase family protein [Janthinobacterium sp. NKUCC06_STL]MBW3512159.1 SOS response-associated peptidase family protein [Janthinobacterium sp. NKUCC06_STL]